MKENTMLYIFGGLPASGKTTLARHLAKEIGATYIRIDSIEEAILKFNKLEGPEGYEAAYALAADNLENGISVVADSVNSIEITRSAWRNIAETRGIEFKEIYITCSNKEEHKKRLIERTKNSKSIRKLLWKDVENREFENWDSAFLFDTAFKCISESKDRFLVELLR
jgi:predicted kinase